MKYTKDALDALTGSFGSPLWLFDENAFIENYRKLEQAMRAFYPAYQIAYSFKTNYTPYICQTAGNMGAYAEVVSGMEYEIAKRTGFEDARIIFNGPLKGEAGIRAFLNGAVVNADSLDEVTELCRAAKEHPELELKAGIRVNLDVGQGFVSRFGIDPIDLPEAFKLVSGAESLRITGLHMHISRARGLKAWEARTRKMLELADRFFAESPEFLDLGSGMFGSMAPEFASQFSDVPTYEMYARVTAGLVAEHYAGRKGPVLFTEPGTTLINRFVDCIARVERIKRIGDRAFAVLNCSTHILGETCTLKRLPVIVVEAGEDRKVYENLSFTGYTCLEQDVMYEGYSGPLSVGDYIVFGNVGGYSNVLKPPFIHPGCAMAAEDTEGRFLLIKRAESYEDLLHTYRFQERVY